MGARSTVSKPLPGGMTFDECVTRFEGDETIDDPEAFCAWLEEQGAEALSDPNAEELLSDLIVEFVSPVDEPAQDSQWLIFKNATDPEGRSHRWKSTTTLYLAKDVDGFDEVDEERQIAFAPVLIPGEADKQGDIVPDHEIERAAHKYLAEYRKVDSDHDLFEGKGVPVESWTLKQATTFDLPDGSESREFPVGTWVLGVKFEDDTWERVKEGDLTGFSIYGGARPIDVDVIREAVGLEKSASNDHGMTESPTADLRERVEQVKQDADDFGSFLDIVDAFIEDHGGEPDEITVAEVVDWWEDFEPEEDEDDEEDGGGGDEESPDEQEQSKSMSDEDNPDEEPGTEAPDDGGDADAGTESNDEQPDADGGDTEDGGDGGDTSVDLPDDTPEWAKSLHETAKSTEEAVGGIRDDVDELQDRVADLEKEVDEGEFANDRMSEDEDAERMKTLKSLGLADEDDDEDTVEAKRKALVEQVEKSVDDDGIEIDYGGIADGDVADGDDDRDAVSKHRNKRMVPLNGGDD